MFACICRYYSNLSLIDITFFHTIVREKFTKIAKKIDLKSKFFLQRIFNFLFIYLFLVAF